MKLVSVNDGVDQMGAEPDIMEFVEQMGGYFESRSLTRLAGRLLGWLLVCDPERQSSEELATALAASSGGISTNARMLIQFGFIERLAVAGDRRTYFRLRPNAFAAGERERIRAMAELQDLADVGLRALGDAPPQRSRRLREMRDLLAYMENVVSDALGRYSEPERTTDEQPRNLTEVASKTAIGLWSLLVDAVARAEVIDCGVTVFVGDRVVQPNNNEALVDPVEGDLVVRTTDGHRFAGAVDGQRVVRAGHVQ